MKQGKIYFLRRADGLIKIGYTTNLKRRLEHLTKAHGVLEVVRLINGDKHREKRLHGRLRAFNEYGEWFRPEQGLIDAISEIEDGSLVSIAKDDGERVWLLGEQECALEARDVLKRLLITRAQRTGLKQVPALKAACADYGLKLWTVNNIHIGRASTVTAYTLKALRQALIAELEAYRRELIQELQNEATQDFAVAQASQGAKRRTT